MEVRPGSKLVADWDILEAIVRIKTELIIFVLILLCSVSFILALPSICLVLVVLAHDFLKSIRLYEFHSLLLVDLVHWNAFVLEREEEVDELRYFVGVV